MSEQRSMLWWGYAWFNAERGWMERFVELYEGFTPVNAKAIYHAVIIVGPFDTQNIAMQELRHAEGSYCDHCGIPLERYSGTTDHDFPYLCRMCAENARQEAQ